MRYHFLVPVLAFIALALGARAFAMPAGPVPAPGLSSFSLTLDGARTGFARSIDGGAIVADVVTEPSGSGAVAKKHLTSVRYEDFVVQAGFGMTQLFYDWISSPWQGSAQRRNGSVIGCDFKLDAVSQQDFSQAVVTEIQFPALDASSKEAGYLTIRFKPESIRNVKPSGRCAEGAPERPKNWITSNFRMELSGLDTSRISKIDAFTLRQAVVPVDAAGRVEIPSLRVTMSEASAQGWRDWHEDFVIRGNNDDSKEKSGAILLLAPNLRDEIARINLFNVGISRLSPVRQENAVEQVRRVEAELYVERMELKVAK